MLADGGSSAAEYVRFHSRRVADVMTKKVISVRRDAPLGEIAETMAKHQVKRVPVLHDNLVVGIVSRSNLLQTLMSREPAERFAGSSDEDLRRKVVAAVDKKP